MALALGLGSLFNHSTSNPNVNFTLNHDQYTISYTTFKKINPGEELCIFYGHQAKFGGTTELDHAESGSTDDCDDDNDEFGGLARLEWSDDDDDGEGNKKTRRTEKEQIAWENEIIPFDHLEWKKVTNIIDPEKLPLTTMEAYTILLPAKHAQLAFSFVRKYAASFSELNHLKRVRPLPSSTSNADHHQHVNIGPEALIEILLFPLASAPPSLPSLLASFSPLVAALELDLLPLPALNIVAVPATCARSDEQAQKWGKVWPVQMVHIREGPKALPRAKGWERGRREWVKREAQRVWNSAVEAGKRGEIPIACHVTSTYFPPSSSSSLSSWSSSSSPPPPCPPRTLVQSSDTRLSTGNILCHAACNAIDAVGVMDRAGARPGLNALEAKDKDKERPYLLTGLSVFLSHEPCLLCAMSLLHSRVQAVYYVRRSPHGGGLGSTYAVHEDQGLNHAFEVWEWGGGAGEGQGGTMGIGCEVKCDC